jgi:hypothetical protein
LRLTMLLRSLRQRDDGLGENRCKHGVNRYCFELHHLFTFLQSQSQHLKV